MTERRTDLLPEVGEFLAVLDAGMPDVTAFPAAELREVFRARQAPLRGEPAMAEVRDTTIAGPDGDPLPLRVYVPHGAPSEGAPLIVFAHGGGFVFCSIDSHDEFARSLADGTGAVVVSVGYRLAPEHPAPAGTEDVYAALSWAHAEAEALGADPGRIAVAGDSAGGCLAATTAIAARDRGGPPIAAQLLFYPVLDDDFETASYREYGEGYYNTAAAMRWYWEQNAPGPREDPTVMPTRAATLASLPPALVARAELDPLCSAARTYAERLRADGVPVRETLLEGLFHGVLTFASFPLAAAARDEVFAQCRELLA